MRRALLPILFVAAGCSRAEAPPPAVQAPVPAPAVVAAPAPGDAPLPAADEVPGFLRGAPAAVEPAEAEPVPDVPVEVALDESAADDWAGEAPGREPTLRELMLGVTVEGEDDDEGESWAFIGGGADSDPEEEDAVAPAEALVVHGEPVEEEPVVIELDGDDADGTAIAAAPAADRCAPLRRLLERRDGYLRRTAAERDTFGYVENEDDVAALRLLQGLRRCAEHPDDEDCRQKPLEVDISDLEVPAHQIHRQPSDLNAEGKTPDQIPHDPIVLDLIHQLRECEKREVVQPLLQPAASRTR